MFSDLDWILRCRTGHELYATLKCFDEAVGPLRHRTELGPPPGATSELCHRCWVLPLDPNSGASPYCPFCKRVLDRCWQLSQRTFGFLVLWCTLNRLPRHLQSRSGFYGYPDRVFHVLDERHFLMMIPIRALKPWIEEMLLYEVDINGLVVVFPPISRQPFVFGDLLARMMCEAPEIGMDQLWIRFYASPFQVFASGMRSRIESLDAEISDFLALLETATVFRSLLPPDAQQTLFELLHLTDANEVQFYWGRLLNRLTPQAIDMLGAWGIRFWPKHRLKMLYNLLDYVEFHPTTPLDPLPAGVARQ